MKNPSKAKRKIADLLTLYFDVLILPEDIWVNAPVYRTKRFDCASWGISVHRDGHHIEASSWDTLGLCTKGLTITQHRDSLEIQACDRSTL